ncbi:MAG: protein kinase domain-containing protein [Aureispira sp.]
MNVWIAYNDLPQEQLELRTPPFASGGEGSLHHIETTGYEGLVAKIYHPQKRTLLRQYKIGYLQEHPPKALVEEEGITLVWPKQLLLDDKNQFIGFLMPYVEGEKLEILSLPKIGKRYRAEWQRYDFSVDTRRHYRLMMCYKIARAIEQLHHSERYVVIDMKPDNIVIQPNGHIALVDLDSIEVVENGETLYDAPVATPEYTPPDSYWKNPEVDPTQEEPWDRFGLAVIFYKVLLGIHPFAASTKGIYADATSLSEKIENGLFVHNPAMLDHLEVIPAQHEEYQRLPLSIQQLFERCFIAGHTKPFARPSATEWALTLEEFNSSARLDSERLKIPNFALQQLPDQLNLQQLLQVPTVSNITQESQVKVNLPLEKKDLEKQQLPSDLQDLSQLRSQRFFNFMILLLITVIAAAVSIVLPWPFAVIGGIILYLLFNYTTFRTRKSAERKHTVRALLLQQKSNFQQLLQTAQSYEVRLVNLVKTLQGNIERAQSLTLTEALDDRGLLQQQLDTFQQFIKEQKRKLRLLQREQRNQYQQLKKYYQQQVTERTTMVDSNLPTIRQQILWLQRQKRLGQLSPTALNDYDKDLGTLELLQTQEQVERADTQHQYQEKIEDLLYRCSERHKSLIEEIERYHQRVTPDKAVELKKLLQEQRQRLQEVERVQYDLQRLEKPLEEQIETYRRAQKTAALYDKINYGRHLLEMVGLAKPL